MKKLVMLSPISDFTDLILQYMIQIWDFLIFIGGAASFIVILVGAILFFVGVKVGKLTGPRLIFGGVMLAITVAYFVWFPPDLVIH